MNTLAGEIRGALRSLRRARGFTIVAALTLALGIGATTSIFSVVDAVLLRRLPFRQADRLVLLWGREARAEGRRPFSFPNFDDVRSQATVFEGIAEWAAYDDYRLALTGSGVPEQLHYGLAGSRLFDVLGVQALRGRTFGASEDARGAPPVTLLTYRLWRTRLGADPDIVGRAIVLDGRPYTVVGVLPPAFRFGAGGAVPDLWLPSAQDPSGVGPRSRQYARGAAYLGVVARLRPGVTLERARGELAQIAARLSDAYPHFDRGFGVDVVPLREQVVADRRATLLVLLAAVGFLLLIACANVAGLLVARGATRTRELAVRVALGANTGQLFRQLLAESLVLAGAGAAGGLALAGWGTSLLGRLDLSSPGFLVPYALSSDQIGLDARVATFAVGIALVAAVLFGVVPALRSARQDPQGALRGGRGGGALNDARLRDVLVVGELALAIVLVFGAALLGRSLDRLQRVDPGFRADNVLAADLSLPRAKYDDAGRVAAFYAELIERLRALPDVRAVGAAEQLPLAGAPQATDFRIAGRPPARPGEVPDAIYASVTPDYFRVLSIARRAGRLLTDADDERAPRVAVVNQDFARRFFPGENPVGQRVALSIEALRFVRDGPPILDFEAANRTIVGVIANVKQHDLTSPAGPAIYLPLRQRPARDMTLVLRTGGQPLALARALRREVAATDPDQPVANIRPLRSVIDATLGQPRSRSLLLMLFAAAAALLAGVGLHGVLAYLVSQRTRELGVRLALGATPGQLLRFVGRRAGRLAAIGAAIGLAGALALGGVLRRFLFGVSADDPLTLLAVCCAFALLTIAAAAIPARRAARIDPVEAMRAE